MGVGDGVGLRGGELQQRVEYVGNTDDVLLDEAADILEVYGVGDIAGETRPEEEGGYDGRGEW